MQQNFSRELTVLLFCHTNLIRFIRKLYFVKRSDIICIYAERRGYMSISYENLWIILAQKGMKRVDLCEKAGITTNTLAKLGKNESVQVEVLSKICGALECSFDDIVKNTGENSVIAPLPIINFSSFDYEVSKEFETLRLNTLRDFPKPHTKNSIKKTLIKLIRECKLSLYAVEVFTAELKEHNIIIDIEDSVTPDPQRIPKCYSSILPESRIYQTERQQIHNFLLWKLNNCDISKCLEPISINNTSTNNHTVSAILNGNVLIYNHTVAKATKSSPYPINLWRDIFGCDGYYFEGHCEYIHNKFEEILDTLTPNEEAIVKCYYSGNASLKDILRQLDLPDTEIIEEVFVEKYISKPLRKLRHPSRSRHLKDLVFDLDTDSNNSVNINTLNWDWSDLFLTPDKIQKLHSFIDFDHVLCTYLTEKTCYNTRLALVEILHDDESLWYLFSIDMFDNIIKVSTSNSFADLSKSITDKISLENSCHYETKRKYTTIEELNLSVRAFNCLKQVGINTVEDLLSKTEDDLMRVRNLGRRCVDEVLTKLSEYGYKLNENGVFEHYKSVPLHFNTTANLSKHYLKLYSLTTIKDENLLIDGFYDNFTAVGFDIAGADWYLEMFANSPHNLNNPSIITQIDNSQLLGALILKKWRHITHWTDQSLLSKENRTCFIVALNRIYQIENGMTKKQ